MSNIIKISNIKKLSINKIDTKVIKKLKYNIIRIKSSIKIDKKINNIKILDFKKEYNIIKIINIIIKESGIKKAREIAYSNATK